MEQKSRRLIDAAKGLLKTNATKDEIIQSISEIGVDKDSAQKLVEEASKELLVEQKNPATQKKGLFSGLFKQQPVAAPVKPLSGTVPKLTAKAEEIPLQGPSQEIFFDSPKTNDNARKKNVFREVLPVRVSDFDKLISKGGLKRGDTILVSGGCGTGKTTFGIQSIYNGALNGDKGVYLSLEESPEKMKENMMQNYGWDIEGLEREGKLAVIKIDPLTIARAVEAALTKERGGLYIEFEQFDLPLQFDLPFKPDRVVVDSLSALSIAFMENEQGYRQYLRHLFETLEKYNSVNMVFGETEQNPGVYSRSGIEEFLADGVIVFYNLKIHNIRQRAIEILKLRSSAHVRKITPYTIGESGFEIYINQELFLEE